jgi:predicted aspartyl protease
MLVDLGADSRRGDQVITGIVTADLEAIITLTLHGPTAREQRIEAVIDTGFDGWLS